ncbi:RNA 2',3'-cyclic phosphodiesterase [Cellulomonas fengjieae]|uniref:RNA 2',3'-cyclic phosphodiesterase n=1 Tax=Cellulomonas fengjieae TaxID=2819978 RepID=A0ABS3SFL1_9CELL|nr:RNA 2',3'-cyclic phosphodiesterase [Cellulomonas fengjieae]MBO3084284.1 RNA 2',3'-cyclic phosphodiesterase [Cellulomonas fengjieae]QVI67362.1 RNA 2',3'-cyclic phosphodiesterase [Cellulomonas fengjieae]
MRLFAAVWPPPDVLDHLDLALASVRGAPAGLSSAVRWSARDSWHLTVAFYGDVPDGAVPSLSAALARVAASIQPYELGLRGAGVFAHRTLWVGVGGDVDAQRALSHGSVQAGQPAGAVDNRARDRPHLTVGRVRPGSRPPRRRSSRPDRHRPRADAPVPTDEDVAASLVRALAVYEGPRWLVDELHLVSSHPGAGRGGGPLYERVETYALGR